MERMAPPSTGITGAFDDAYLANLTSVCVHWQLFSCYALKIAFQIVNYITDAGAYAVIERKLFANCLMYKYLT